MKQMRNAEEEISLSRRMISDMKTPCLPQSDVKRQLQMLHKQELCDSYRQTGVMWVAK
jgi:hypothetical protein